MRLRAAGQPSRAGLVPEEVGVRHVERHSRLRSSDELAALYTPPTHNPVPYDTLLSNTVKQFSTSSRHTPSPPVS